MNYQLNQSCADQFVKEYHFNLFRHEGFLCLVARMPVNGHINGYVGISKDHPLYGKSYSDKITLEEAPKFNGNYIGLLCHSLEDNSEGVYAIDMALSAPGGITYSDSIVRGLDEQIFPDTWWFGFDTAHAGDDKPIYNDFDISFPTSGVYRTFDYVEDKTKKLAEQLALLK